MKSLAECERALKMTPLQESMMPTSPPPRVVSMLPTRRIRKISDSDEESVLDDEEKPEVEKHPVLNLRPVSRIIGFDGKGDGDSKD